MFNLFSKKTVRKGEIINITSYPKSGNTWLRFILGYYFFDKSLDFKSINEVMPDMHFNPKQKDKLNSKYIFVKTHDIFDSINKTIYIVRDGRDVAVSYFYHMKRTGEISEELSFSSFLREHFFAKKYFGGWGDQIKKAISVSQENAENYFIVKYEDMITQTNIELEKILNWLGEKIDYERLKFAIHSSSFEELKKVEKSNEDYIYKERGLIKKEYGFIRKGIAGDWKSHFSESDLKDFMSVFGAQLKIMDYV